ncbi:alpha/beta hydrolase [Streptomonospora sp. S1-112]|uniref:Alpha/beta hydrolase n=1 Tax=Streptomonospora mangrovi TaxID=2883123 RepID=A0A9X3NWZ2_9ACTN|nr:alpha/beta fold hydrolase [Streptomonospora mangrovi]MDA0565851.1 alpha/beta hydrolase [Streptomonospora mangrovi]
MNRPRPALLAPLALPVLLVLGGCSTADAQPVADSTAPAALSWSACAGDVAAALECAELDVPVDYDDPGGATITLTLARAAATGEGDPLGTVLFNPGGPGGSGVGALSRSLANFAGLRERMDVVTWDPRGGQSGEHLPLENCATGPAFATPDNRRAYERAAEANAEAVAACRDAAPEVFANMDSATQARDMDAIRAALGEEELSYLGNSYGGVLGASYARLFPERVRVMALDSVPDHVSPMAESERLQYEGLEAVFERFTAWCAEDTSCALHGSDAEEVWQDTVRRAERDPLPGAEAAGDRRYDGDDLKALAQSMVLREANWPAFAEAVAAAADGDAAKFDPRGRGLPPQPSALLAVRCADGFAYDGYRAYRRAVERSESFSPNFSGVRENAHLACSSWSPDAVNPPAPLPADELPPILGVAPVYEEGSVRAVTDAVPGSVTVGYDGIGHGLYVNHGDPCAIGHVDRYLIDGVLPDPGTSCPAPDA